MERFVLTLLLCSSAVCGFLPSSRPSKPTKNVFSNHPKKDREGVTNILHEHLDRATTRLSLAWDDDDEDEDGDDLDIDLSDKDWRAFRAKLVMGEPPATSSTTTQKTSSSSNKQVSQESVEPDHAKEKVVVDDGDLDGIGALFSSEQQEVQQLQEKMTPLDPSQWAYDSGKVIEQGAVILGGVEQDYGFGLRQQYFHKAAILVLDHDDRTFTKGIILNRPSDLTLTDDETGTRWRVFFGGDVQGLNSFHPEIVCLHTLKNEMVLRASIQVINDIHYTSFDSAKKLVQAGFAKSTDFWVFAGYAGWGPGQLMGELERKSWYMVATDSQTLLKELQQQDTDPRDAGLDTWLLLMNMIGRSETAAENTGGFDDLMLKEWALENLLSTEAGGGAGMIKKPTIPETISKEKKDPVEQLLQRVKAKSRGEDVSEGDLLRATDSDRSPFRLDDQALHKSLMLVIKDDDLLRVGVILNRPGARGLEVRVEEKDSGKSRLLNVPLRYGGQYKVQGSEPLLWLHCNSSLKAAQVGAPVGEEEGIWKCTNKDMVEAVGQGLATPEDFFVVTGVTVWTKGETGVASGSMQTIKKWEEGRFKVVPLSKTQTVWNELARQTVISEDNFIKNIEIGEEAWRLGANEKEKNGKNGVFKIKLPAIGGLGEGYDEEDDSLVYKSDTKVATLSDESLRRWVCTFLLGDPTLGD